MNNFNTLFPSSKPIIGMIHTAALPGTPKFNGSVDNIIKRAIEEAQIYKKAGIDGLIIENMHDVPYLKEHIGHEISSILAIIAYEIKKFCPFPIGIQILSSANEAALAVALNAGLDFIRAEGFVFGHLADEGYIDSCAGRLLRYRKQIGAEHVAIWTDIKKKHSAHTLTADVDIVETAKAAEYFLSDGLIITGASTALSADTTEIKKVKNNCGIPVLVGSGVRLENLEDYLPICDGVIIGSHFKKAGYWGNDLDIERIEKFLQKARKL